MEMNKMKIDEMKEKGYQMLAECIRSDQLSARQVHEEFEADPEFKDIRGTKCIK